MMRVARVLRRCLFYVLCTVLTWKKYFVWGWWLCKYISCLLYNPIWKYVYLGWHWKSEQMSCFKVPRLQGCITCMGF
jgi:hypothetical protein